MSSLSAVRSVPSPRRIPSALSCSRKRPVSPEAGQGPGGRAALPAVYLLHLPPGGEYSLLGANADGSDLKPAGEYVEYHERI